MQDKKKKNTLNNTPIILSKKVDLKERYNFYEYISVMLDGWVSIEETLSSVHSRVKSPYFQQQIEALKVYISSWDSFSKSMKKMPQIFPAGEVAIVESWEMSGNLVQAFSQLSEQWKKIHDLQNKIKWALTYPLIIFLFLLLSIILVLTYVIPAIIPLFETSEVALPASTQALVFVSDFVRHNFFLLFLFLCSLGVAFVGYKNTKAWGMQIEEFLFSLPLLWKLYRNYTLSLIASNFANLTGSWVSVIKTLHLVWKSSNSLIYESLFEQVGSSVSKGSKIVEAMKDSDPENLYFPPPFLQMLAVWERTASLQKVNKKLSIGYEKELDYSLANLSKWIEPIALLIAWVFVLWFAFAIFWAILKVTQVVG